MSPEQVRQRNLQRVHVDGIHAKGHSFDIRNAKVAVVGLSREGLSLAIRAASAGLQTIGFDADEVKIAQLQAAHEGNLLDAEDNDAWKSARSFNITSDTAELRRSDIFLLSCNGDILEEAAGIVAHHVSEGALVIVETIVEPGTCEHVLLPIFETASGLTPPRATGLSGDFFFAYAPKLERFGALGTERNVRVIGACDEEGFSRARSFYEFALGSKVIAAASVKEAESLRMVENAFRDVNIAIANELATVFDRMGVDVTNVIEAASADLAIPLPLPGIHSDRTSAKNRYLARSGHEHELDQQFLAVANRVISRMPDYAVQVLADALREKRRTFKDCTIALLGLAREKDGSDTSDSPALKIRDKLAKKGANVRSFDPFVSGSGGELKDAMRGANAVVIATDHSMFCNLTPHHFEEFDVPLVIDARNCLDKRAFEKSSVTYRGIGRG